jgi:hypothetical protein
LQLGKTKAAAKKAVHKAKRAAPAKRALDVPDDTDGGSAGDGREPDFSAESDAGDVAGPSPGRKSARAGVHSRGSP